MLNVPRSPRSSWLETEARPLLSVKPLLRTFVRICPLRLAD
jgi:hypothetical protein